MGVLIPHLQTQNLQHKLAKSQFKESRLFTKAFNLFIIIIFIY